MPRVLIDDAAGDHHSILVYGSSGSGKTVLSGSALRYEPLTPIFYADFERGYRPLRTFFASLWDKMSLWAIEQTNELDIIEKVVFSENTPFNTIVIDSMTQYYTLLMKARLQDVGREGGTPSQPDYYHVGDALQTFLWRVKRESKINLIATAGHQVTEDSITGSLIINPDLTGKLARRIPRLFDIVGYLTTERRVTARGELKREARYLQVQPYGRIRAKDRTASLGPRVTNPTMERLFRALEEAPPAIFLGDDGTGGDPEEADELDDAMQMNEPEDQKETD